MAFAIYSTKAILSFMQPFTTSSSTCSLQNPVNLGSSTENYAFSTETCVTEFYINATSTGIPVTFNSDTSSDTAISSSSDFSLIPTFTGDGIIIITILLVFLFIVITGSVIKAIDRIKTKKRYLRYSNADVEISDEM